MLDYFNENFARAKGRVIDPSFISIHDSVIKNHPRIRERYINSSHHVSPDHILIKILSGLGLTKNMNMDTLDYHVKDIARGLANSLRVTSHSSYGTTFSGQFLNSGSESIMFVYEPYDKVRWTELTPVEFLYHSNTNTNFQVGTPDDDSAFAFIKINVPMLAYQFLEWHKWRAAGDVQENTYNFLAKYPIFNSLKSYMDISLFNRHYYRIIGTPIPDDPKVHEYPTPNISDRLDKSNLKTINMLMGKGTTMGGALYNTPSFYKYSALDLANMPRTITTRQLEWLLITAKLPYLHYGLSIAYQTGDDLNQGVLSNLTRELKAFINTRTLDKLPKHLSVWIIEYLEKMIVLTSSLK